VPRLKIRKQEKQIKIKKRKSNKNQKKEKTHKNFLMSLNIFAIGRNKKLK
tara:strand:+ start:1531 stop:1680 length:150 start_codon:yes stop_codon:yes gene_type:complete